MTRRGSAYFDVRTPRSTMLPARTLIVRSPLAADGSDNSAVIVIARSVSDAAIQKLLDCFAKILTTVRHPVAEVAGRAGNDRSWFVRPDAVAAAILATAGG